MYQIWRLPYFYAPDIQGQNAPKPIVDMHGDIEEYEDIPAAQAVIDELQDGVYILEHNEHSAPDLIIVDDVTGDYVYSGRNFDMSNYDWDGWDDPDNAYVCACPTSDGDACGECGNCIERMINQDRTYIRSRMENSINES